MATEIWIISYLALCADVVLNDLINTAGKYGGFKQEFKQRYKNFTQYLMRADSLFDHTFQDDLIFAANGSAVSFDGYRKDANEIIQHVMSYIDKCNTQEGYDQVWGVLDKLPSAGLFSEDEIKRFDYIWGKRE